MMRLAGTRCQTPVLNPAEEGIWEMSADQDLHRLNKLFLAVPGKLQLDQWANYQRLRKSNSAPDNTSCFARRGAREAEWA